ncbi:3-oxoacyl-ACP reductase [Glutamicibacter protophormiae]|uniref:3-oxoacyl-[acyl-carrier-protein] reductase FabG n=1 Tax=Kocuria varians TaxID=1272 RepID=A0A7D7KXS2_KOCVA|nr:MULTISPECIES: 3-oxoacyl-ACP reductase [Kocuria]WNB88647.1 3-oxoacyl-ACP reductase [Glutamicibacter protophormiae]MDN5632529.1 3-oxoacyl-ACP reductase [Kocuria sp.]QMS55845.1 3-oxoacyl-[acyl-carrier-protein] reductase FabG [Kocuria varians]RUP82254.1 3-oxoacyl-ACP reductase [Kocuria sp. HSID17590]RUQ11344.1 3-oxoacyl-ACP reductase [Kocuria sp. HSID17582]
MRIENTIVLVTGGARGLGEHLSRAFAREGARVVVNYHSSEERANALVQELGEDWALAVCADVTDAQQVRDMVARAREHFGAPITVAVNNALVDFSFNGDARPTLDTLTAENLTQQFEGAVVGGLNVMQAVVPGMAEAGEGRIINIGTNLFQNPVVPYHDYTAAKAALLSLTRTAAKDLGPQGITVNMISGGLLRTTDASAATPDEVFDFIAAGTPLGRVTTPEEFADTALFFASDWSRGVTGQNLVVDGGLVVD